MSAYEQAVERARCVLEHYPCFEARALELVVVATQDEAAAIKRERWERPAAVIVTTETLSADELAELRAVCVPESTISVVRRPSGEIDYLRPPTISVQPDFTKMEGGTVAEFAREREFYEVALQQAARALRKSQSLSPALSQLVADHLSGEAPPKRKRRADQLVILAVCEAVEAAVALLGTYYRNSATEGFCACDAVAEAGKRCGESWTYDSVASRLRQAAPLVK